MRRRLFICFHFRNHSNTDDIKVNFLTVTNVNGKYLYIFYGDEVIKFIHGLVIFENYRQNNLHMWNCHCKTLRLLI